MYTFPVFLITLSIHLMLVIGDLPSKEVSEGPCNPDTVSMGAKSINPIWFSQRRNYFVPIASEACYRGYAEVLLGRPATSEIELESMKLRIESILPLSFRTTGFAPETRTLIQVCPPSNRNQVLCLPIGSLGSRGTNTSGIITSADTIYYTDNKTTILIIRCLNSSVQDYKVLTTEPTVGQETRNIILAKIQELGFSSQLMRTMTY